jgi:nicotinate-nucleotide adenylyltransferase
MGGSFNPAHEGHRHIALLALAQLGLDRVWWLVSPQNPLKPGAGMAVLADRLASAKAMARHPAILATDIETALGTRYTIDTVRALQKRVAHARFVWLMGADNLAQISAWRDWPGLFHAVPIAVFDRPTYSSGALFSPAARRFDRFRRRADRVGRLVDETPPAWVFLRCSLHRESATRIRATGAWPTRYGQTEAGQGSAK